MPFAASAASTSAELARRSVAITSAPFSLPPPIVAMCPFKRMSAPILASSLTCMKRFSKSRSSIVLVPAATHARAMNCACISVGKPGYSVVTISAGLIFAGGRIVMAPPEISNLKPISSNLLKTALRCDGCTFVTVICEPVIAPAHR